MFAGGDALDGKVGFVGVDRHHRGDLGDGETEAMFEFVPRFAFRFGQQAVQGVDDLVIDLPLAAEIGGVGLVGLRVHVEEYVVS